MLLHIAHLCLAILCEFLVAATASDHARGDVKNATLLSAGSVFRSLHWVMLSSDQGVGWTGPSAGSRR